MLQTALQDTIGFIAIGQAGGNIGKLFERRGFSVLYLNTSKEDLDTLKDEAKFLYHIKRGEGCHKDRDIAKELMIADYESVYQQIEEKIHKSFIYVIFSLGGGTGSGAAPMLIDLLSQELLIKKGIDKNNMGVGAITIFPDTTESIKAQINTYECCKELWTIDSIATNFVLDNKRGNKFQINEKFVSDFVKFLSIPQQHKSTKGNIDKAEVMETIKTHGAGIVLCTKQKDTIGLLKQMSNTIYAPIEKDKVIKYISLSSTRNVSIEELMLETGVPIDCFQTFNREINILTLTGLSFPKTRLEEVYNIIQKNSEIVRKSVTSINSSSIKEFFHEDFNLLKDTEKTKKDLKIDDNNKSKSITKIDVMNKYRI